MLDFDLNQDPKLIYDDGSKPESTMVLPQVQLVRASLNVDAGPHHQPRLLKTFPIFKCAR